MFLDLFLRIVERKAEKSKAQTERTDNPYLKRREARTERTKAKQEMHRIERLIVLEHHFTSEE